MMKGEQQDVANWGDQDFEQAVRDTAYFLWENDGRPPGREKEYWYRALEQLVAQRQRDRELQNEPPGQRGE